jgi:hypothetical protein
MAGDGPVVRGRVAYCSQVPWIMAATLKDNILFGAAPDKGRYAAVVEAAALGQDLAELPAGDETELGERGINLSGEGWQWRGDGEHGRVWDAGGRSQSTDQEAGKVSLQDGQSEKRNVWVLCVDLLH